MTIEDASYALFFILIYTYVLGTRSPAYKFAQAAAWGSTVGVRVVNAADTLNRIAYIPLVEEGNIALLLPMLMGALLFVRFVSPRHGYVRRIPMAFQMGAVLGLGMIKSSVTGIGTPLRQFFNRPIIGTAASPGTPIDNLIMWIFGICTLTYFIFVRGERGLGKFVGSKTFGYLVRIGRIAIMIGLGYGLAGWGRLTWYAASWRTFLQKLGLMPLV